MARTLALDVGNRRIGVAVSDASKLLARPLLVIDRNVEDAVLRIAELLTAHDVDELVVGLPFHADGRMGSQAHLVRAFVESVTAATHIPITYVDERHSTQDAKAIIAENKKRKQPVHDDAVAAAVILQRSLDERREAYEDELTTDDGR